MSLNKNLGGILEWLYPDGRPLTDWIVEQGDDGVCRITRWALPGVARPTDAEVMSREREYLALPPDWRQRRSAKKAIRAADCMVLRALAKVLIERDAEVRQALNDLPTTRARAPLPVMTYEQLLALLESET